MSDPRFGEGCGFATIPTRECSECGERTICRDIPDKGRLCGVCELVVMASDVAVWESDEVKAVVMPLIERGEDGTALMESYGAVVGGVLRYLIDNPHMLTRLQREAERDASA